MKCDDCDKMFDTDLNEGAWSKEGGYLCNECSLKPSDVEGDKKCCWNEEKKEWYNFESISPTKKQCLGCGKILYE